MRLFVLPMASSEMLPLEVIVEVRAADRRLARDARPGQEAHRPAR